MNTTSARTFGLVLALCISLPALAPAQNAPAAEPPPQAEAGTTVQAKCINENDGYKLVGKTPHFVIELENKCEQRMACRVFAYVTSAKGAAQGRGTLVLAQASRGAAAKKSFTMRVKMIGGSSQSTRECHVL